MNDFPIHYIEPVFRPPSEAQSLILPLTNGCSWNRCTYCEMYTAEQKAFALHPEAAVQDSIRRCAEQFGAQVQRVFLGDGDALVLSTRRLLTVLQAIAEHLPGVHRVSAYCLARNLRNKSAAELTELRQAGLKLVYLGAESGDDEVLRCVNKGDTFDTTAQALDKLAAAGISRSVMLLNGLGGRALSAQHAANSAKLMNLTQPEYLSTLVVSFPQGETRFRAGFAGWSPLDVPGLLAELAKLLQALDLRRTVFRSDHASNWLVLKGTLGADKERLLAQLQQAIAQPGSARLRAPWQRGL